MIDWVFLDVGNILLDEDPLTCFVFRRHVEAIQRVRPDRSFADLLAEREARASAGSAWPLYQVAARYLDDDECRQVWIDTEREVRQQYAALSPTVAGAERLLDWLAPRARLGLVANQGRECRERLAALGWLGRFDVVALSEEVGVAKPDGRLFERALDHAGAQAARSLMVGDRLDNDLEPAARLGMATAWVRWPERGRKGWQPRDPEAAAYLRSLERCALSRAAAGPWAEVQPCVVVDEVADLPAALGPWLGRSDETTLLAGADSTPYDGSPSAAPAARPPGHEPGASGGRRPTIAPTG